MEPDRQEEIPQYQLDPDTEALVHTVIELALMSANLQINPRDSQTVVNICTQAAYRLGIEIDLVEVALPEPDPSTDRIDLTNFPFRFRVIDKDEPEL